MLRHSRRIASDGLVTPAMTQFREQPQSEGLRELALPLPPLPCPRGYCTPRFLLDRRPMAGSLGEINLRSLTADDVVGDYCDSQGKVATSPFRRGMSSYAPGTARDKPTECWRDDNPRRSYRGHPRRYFCCHGRPPDPRISPEQEIGEKNSRHNDQTQGPHQKDHHSRVTRERASSSV